MAIISLALAATTWNRSTTVDDPRAGGLSYDPVPSVGRLRPREERTVPFVVENRTDRAVRVVEATDRCGTGICLKAEGLPMAIPPRTSLPIRVRMMGSIVPGKFSQDFTLYTDCPGQPEIVLTVSGYLDAPATASPDGGVRHSPSIRVDRPAASESWGDSR